ncbi:RDD family protein [Blautia schinkii]|nr:RDD family protein [Blautia schinkii]
MRKASNVLLRILCAAVDFIIILVPIQFVMMGIFNVSTRQADLLFQLLFAVYGTLATEYFGKTFGKYLGKLRVVDTSGQKPVMLYLGLRELSKALYLVPYAGLVLLAVSGMMMVVRKDGRALHDLVGNTQVVFAWQVEEEV